MKLVSNPVPDTLGIKGAKYQLPLAERAAKPKTVREVQASSAGSRRRHGKLAAPTLPALKFLEGSKP